MAPAGNYLNSANSADYLQVSTTNAQTASNVTIGTNWTIESWVKFPLPANGAGGWNTLFRGLSYHHIIVERSTNSTGLYLGCHFGGFYPCTINGVLNGAQGFDVSTLSSGWHHIAAVGTGGNELFYVDGIFVGKTAAQITNDPIVAIGNYQGGGQEAGAMDEVKIYNTALSQNAISNNMTQASTASSDPYWNNLVAYYKMDGTTPVPNSSTGSAACNTCSGVLEGAATVSTATAFYTYNWSNTGGATFAPAASTTSESVTISGAASGNLSVYASVNGCNSLTTTTPITVVPVPVVSNQTATVCGNSANGTFNVTPSSSQPSTTYTWATPAISPASSITGGSAQPTSQTSISQTLVNTTNAAATATYTVTPTAGGCPGNTFTVGVTVNPVPAITAMSTTICSAIGFTVTPVTVTNGIVPAGTTYSWSAPTVTGGMTGGAASSGSPTSITGTLTNPTNTPQTATYTVTPFSSASLGTCQGASFTVTVTVNPTPVVTNAGTASTL